MVEALATGPRREAGRRTAYGHEAQNVWFQLSSFLVLFTSRCLRCGLLWSDELLSMLPQQPQLVIASRARLPDPLSSSMSVFSGVQDGRGGHLPGFAHAGTRPLGFGQQRRQQRLR